MDTGDNELMQTEKAITQLHELKRLASSMRLAAEHWHAPWQTLIAIIMSARTRDEVTIEVGKKLFAKYSSLEKLARAKPSAVSTIIYPVNFYRNKTKSVIGCARMLSGVYKGKPPHAIEQLITLPGVGRKTANVFLAEMGKSAIGVDTHVAYISRILRWTEHRDPQKIEKDLEQLFPKRLWRSINSACVQFGKTYQSRRKKDALLAGIRSN